MTPVESPSAIVGSFLVGFVFCAACVAAFVALIQLRDWLDVIAERKAAAAERAATRTRTWAERWGGRAADIAAIEASVARGEQQVILHAIRRKPKNETRLADFAAEQKRRRSA